MDATQKRRMRRVAIAHFILTILVVLKLLHYSAWSGPYEREIWFMAWGSFWAHVLFLLQMPLWFFYGTGHSPIIAKIISALPEWLPICLITLSIPVWSNCVGWIFIKLKDWLNHFPVLGRKVF